MTTADVNGDLQTRLARLEAENSTLRHRLEAQPPPPPEQDRTRRHRGRGWTALATVLVILGCLMAPVGILAAWSKATLTDTDSFVATYAPLAHTPQLQSFVVDQADAAINENLNLDQLVSDVIDGVKALGTGPRASTALDALKGPATQGVQAAIRNGITAFVASDQFASSWERALRLSHTQMVATMTNDPSALIQAQTDGSVAVQLGPIVADVKAALVARGVSIADRIPAVHRSIPIGRASQLPAIQTAYQIVVAVGSWLPWVALLLLTAGVLVARRRSVALLWTALGLAFSMLLLQLALSVGRAVLVTEVPATSVPSSVTTLLYDTATAAVRATAVSTLVLALAVAIVGWLAGPFRAPRRLRALVNDGFGVLRRNAAAHNVSTGRVGDWVYAQRRVLHVLIALASAAAIIALRPLSGSDIGWTAALAVLALVLVSLVERPPMEAPPSPGPIRDTGQTEPLATVGP